MTVRDFRDPATLARFRASVLSGYAVAPCGDEPPRQRGCATTVLAYHADQGPSCPNITLRG